MLNSSLSIFIILSQILKIIYYSRIYLVERVVLDIICVIIYYILINSNVRLLEKQKLLNEKIEILSRYNRNLIKINDDVRAFKHDFNNIMQAIGGYIEFNDFEGLKTYYQDLITECNLVKNLTLINPIAINEQNLCNTILKKIESAQSKGISVEFVSFVDFQAIQIEYLEFYKVIENMLERATALAENSKNKEILVDCFYDEVRNKNVIVLASSYEEKTKRNLEEEIKLGTWKKEIKEYIPKKDAIELYVSIDDKLLVQELDLKEKIKTKD